MLNKEQFKKIILREDIVEFLSSKSQEELEDMLGKNFSRMKGFEQKNIHHCYDLLGHTLNTVKNIDTKDLNEEEKINLKSAALFHDIGKPDVATINPKSGQQVFYGHALKSKEIAEDIYKELGFNDSQIEKMSFYIEHHDDFISYKTNVPEYMHNHEFIREINSTTVAEKVLENKYDFEAMGLNKNQIRYVCYALAHEEEPDFRNVTGSIKIDIDMNDIKQKMASREYMKKYIPNRRDYSLLTNLCKADAKAQTELYKENGKILCSRKEKVQNMNNIENSIEEAYRKVENVTLDIELEKNIIDEIVKETDKNIKLSQVEKEAKELTNEYKQMLKREKELKNNKQI